jgi:hypothetical protein
MEPITPKEFQKCYGNKIPEVVIQVVNDIIKTKATYEDVTTFLITQPEVVNALVSAGVERNAIFTQQMLDFEPYYRKAGWKVEWNKGAYFEDESQNYWIFKS